MKTLSRLVALIVLVICPARAASLSYTNDAFQKGCAAIVAASAEPKNASDSQKQLATEATAYIKGFLDGAMLRLVASRQKDYLLTPPMKWEHDWEEKFVVKSLLQFFDKHHEIIVPEAPAGTVMYAWYFSNHPDATEAQRTEAFRTLEDLAAAAKEFEKLKKSGGNRAPSAPSTVPVK
jgi:hypothetical protein